MSITWGNLSGVIVGAGGRGIWQGQHIYTEDLIEFSGGVHAEGTVQWHVMPLPFHLRNWLLVFHSHPDKNFAQCIQDGLKQGFRLGCQRPEQVRLSVRNHPSVSPHACSSRIYSGREVTREMSRTPPRARVHIGACQPYWTYT